MSLASLQFFCFSVKHRGAFVSPPCKRLLAGGSSNDCGEGRDSSNCCFNEVKLDGGKTEHNLSWSLGQNGTQWGEEEMRDPAADGEKCLDRIVLDAGGREKRTSVPADDEHLERDNTWSATQDALA